ncbi:MAG: hypothetical protein LBC64_04700 [Fibromonadaceae bacterium]|nr:hypothetical protein [Fibromonadaceae bacterium]
MYISANAFLFCLGLAVLLGWFFAWVYNYRRLHKTPKDMPHRLTETIGVPIIYTTDAQQDGTAVKRSEQERVCSETDSAIKDSILEKLLALFRSRLEKENDKILSICYWVFSGEGFALRICNSPYRVSENLFVPQDDRCFSKKEFNCCGEEIPIDVFQSENQIVNSMAGALVSGSGKKRGYITIDSTDERVFSDKIYLELRELASLAEKMLRTLDMNFKLNKENTLFNGILKDILDLFRSASKGNLIANLSKILQDNFRFDRLMIITPDEKERDLWHISEVVGEQKEVFKGISFNVHVKCLLYELFARKVSSVKELKISTDPYICRFYESEPKNLELRSLFAVAPQVQNNSYPLVIVLESKNDSVVSLTDEIMLSCIVSCAALKLSDIQNKDESRLKDESDWAGIDSNGLGSLLSYYETEVDDLKNNDDSLGILFFKCIPIKKENKVADFKKIPEVFKSLKKAWNGRHLAMIGNDEIVLSIRGDFKEDIFKIMAMQMITSAESMLSEHSLFVKSYTIWLDNEKLEEMMKKTKQPSRYLFTVTVTKKFREMLGDV